MVTLNHDSSGSSGGSSSRSAGRAAARAAALARAGVRATGRNRGRAGASGRTQSVGQSVGPSVVPRPRDRPGTDPGSDAAIGVAAARPVGGALSRLRTRIRPLLHDQAARVRRGLVGASDATGSAWAALSGRGASRVARTARRLLGRRGRKYARYAAVSTRAFVDRRARPGPWRIAVNVLSAVVFALIARWAPMLLPPAAVGLFLVLGSHLVRLRHLVRDAALIGVIVLVVLALTGEQFSSLVPVTGVCLGSVLVGCVQRRARAAADCGLGDGPAADAVLVDLRNEMLIRSERPTLPAGWRLDCDLRPAHGDTFSGDFLLTQQTGPDSLELVLVDVSGNGYQAGARALLLAGAMRALLDAVPAAGLIAATNHHVVRLGDDLGVGEGFATAVHVSLDLVDGGFVVTAAGHPPVAHYHAGSGRWEVLDGEQGPALGVVGGVEYPALAGRLERGDVLMLYTDGLVENRGLDVGRGIDRLVGRADPLIARGIEDPAAHITGAIRAQEGDDRALVILRRG